jgi:hypothetical protein
MHLLIHLTHCGDMNLHAAETQTDSGHTVTRSLDTTPIRFVGSIGAACRKPFHHHLRGITSTSMSLTH